jgi:excisionase family DNA binding protein
MTTKAQDRWLTTSQFLQTHKGLISKTTLHDRLRDGSIPHVRLRNKILIPSDVLDQLLEQRGREDRMVEKPRTR